MSKIDTSPETRFPRLPLLKACFGFGFGFGFVGLRRWSENFGWGRMGLVYAIASRRMALAPPLPPSHRAKIFRLHPIRSKIGQPFNFLDSRSIRSLHQTMEQVDGETLAWFRDRRPGFECHSIIRQLLPNPRQKRRAVNVWNHWGFSILYQNVRHLFPVQFLYQISPKKFFRQILNDFNRLQLFLFVGRFWHGSCNNISRTRTKPSVYGGPGWQPVICRVRVQWGSLWHTFPYAPEFVETTRMAT